MADKSKPARSAAPALYVGEGPGPELFLLPKPFAVFRGGADERGEPLAFIPGVPARDLTQAEWETLTDEQRQTCLTTNLYDVAGEIPAEG